MSGFGLLGERLGHSFSPRIHAALGGYDYALYEVSPAGLGGFLQTTELSGMNVTIPYKKAVLPYCASLSEAARSIGSVNTLVRRPEGWYGDNTDAFGFAYLLRRCGCRPEGKVCTVLGSGGAALTVRSVLRSLGAARVDLLSRSGRNDYLYAADYADAEIVVNATPVGMFPDCGAAALGASAFPKCAYAIDLIYNPLRTEFLLEFMQMNSAKRTITCENGLSMLVAQAARSAELFTGEAISEARIEETLCKLSGDAESVILIGMPGCGKTTVGALLARRLCKPFVDLDAEIAAQTGKTPETWLRTVGEAAFRAAETAVLRRITLRGGVVLACGGGVVTRPENENLLRRNGRVVWLQRKLCKLETRGRPLSENGALSSLFAQREPLYARFSDLAVSNDGAPEETVKTIMEALQ